MFASWALAAILAQEANTAYRVEVGMAILSTQGQQWTQGQGPLFRGSHFLLFRL